MIYSVAFYIRYCSPKPRHGSHCPPYCHSMTSVKTAAKTPSDICKEFFLYCRCWHNNALSLLNYGVVYCGCVEISLLLLLKSCHRLLNVRFYCFHIFGEYIMVPSMVDLFETVTRLVQTCLSFLTI